MKIKSIRSFDISRVLIKPFQKVILVLHNEIFFFRELKLSIYVDSKGLVKLKYCQKIKSYIMMTIYMYR